MNELNLDKFRSSVWILGTWRPRIQYSPSTFAGIHLRLRDHFQVQDATCLKQYVAKQVSIPILIILPPVPIHDNIWPFDSSTAEPWRILFFLWEGKLCSRCYTKHAMWSCKIEKRSVGFFRKDSTFTASQWQHPGFWYPSDSRADGILGLLCCCNRHFGWSYLPTDSDYFVSCTPPVIFHKTSFTCVSCIQKADGHEAWGLNALACMFRIQEQLNPLDIYHWCAEEDAVPLPVQTLALHLQHSNTFPQAITDSAVELQSMG